MGWDPAQVPDPQDEQTFVRSKLDWSELAAGRHAVVLDAYRRLASAASHASRQLTDPSFAHVSCTADEDTRVFTMRRDDLLVVVNFGTASQAITLDSSYDEVLFETPSGVTLDGLTLALPPTPAACWR